MIEIIGQTTADKIKEISQNHSKREQWEKAREEVEELLEELMAGANPFSDDNLVYLTDNTWSECADVIIMIAQLAMQHGQEETVRQQILYKIDRQLERDKEVKGK